MKSAPELWDVLREAYSMPYGAAQIALVDQLLRQVDASGDAELAYATRSVGTTAYVYGGEPAKAFVTFAWALSDFDRNPAPHHAKMQHSLLWDFKTMITALLKFPEVPLDRTYAVIEDMERRYREGGHSLQAVHKQRYLVAEHVGDTAEAARWYERWVTAPRDSLSDCIGCDPSDKVHYLASRGRDEEAVALAGPVLAGELTCTEQPQTILNELMEPYLRTGRPDDAADAHRRAYRLQRGKLADLADLGGHIAFCARSGNEHRGLEMLQRHIDWLAKAPSPAAEMCFAADAAFLLRRLTAIGHGDATVRLLERGDVTAAVLGGELAARATALAARFDARNGTREQGRRIAERLTAEPFDVTLPLSPTARQSAHSEKPAQPETTTPEIPADAGPEMLLDLADEHEREDRDEAVAATLAAFDARFPDPGALGPRIAGRRAALRGAQLFEADHAAAIEAMQHALDQFSKAGAEREPEASAVRGRLGIAYCLVGRLDEGRALVEADLAYQDHHGQPRDRAAAWSRMSNVHFLAQDPTAADAAQDRADTVAADLDDARLAALYALRRARNRAAIGRRDEAVAAARQARDFYREHGPVTRWGDAAAVYGQLLEDPAEIVAAFGEVLSTGTPGPELTARVWRGRALVELDRAAEAVPDLVEAVALSTEQDLAEAGAFTRQDLANAYRLADRPVEAAEVAEEALSAFERLEFEEPANDTRMLLAGLYRQLGDNAGALALYQDLLTRLADNPAGRGQVGEQAGQLLFDIDHDAEAAETFQVAADDLAAAGDPLGETRLLRRRLIALHYADDVPAAEETVRIAAERFAAMPPELAEQPGAIWGRAMFGFEASRLLMARGRYADARPHLENGPAVLRAIGATDDADQVEGMYAEALLRSGAPERAEALLRPLLDGMRPDAPTRPMAAELLADTLDALDRAGEATELRIQEGLNDR
jgi:tetratricopeptide (TPR) repeat protein